MLGQQQGGSNSLRGGKKKYGPKTKCGNWVELNKEPGQSIPSGFPHAMYRTDAHQQMLEGVLQRPTRFGAGLPPQEDPRIDYARVINYDRQQRDSQWAGITTTEFVAPGDAGEKSKEFASSFTLTGGMTDPGVLEEYRRSWTVEKDCVRPVRFKTDAVTSANTGVPARFRLTETRALPGTPKAVERLRTKALEYGQMGVVRLRQALQPQLKTDSSAVGFTDGPGGGSGLQQQQQQHVLQAGDLVAGLKSAGLTPLTTFDVKKVIEFFGREGSGSANVVDILEGLRFGNPITEEHRSRAVADAFRKMDESGSGLVGEADLRRRYDSDPATDACTGRPKQEARKAIVDTFSIYQANGGMTSAGFEKFMTDVSCGVRSAAEFEAVLDALVGG
ncbi:unnamed protein product [Hapterophycus canaliculatus]